MEENSSLRCSKMADETEEINDDNIFEESPQLNLSCLFSPNWLNDEIIDHYLELLQNIDGEVFIF